MKLTGAMHQREVAHGGRDRRAASRVAPPVQRKALDANHRRIGELQSMDAAEQQAEQAGQRIARHERVVARDLKPVPAATVAPLDSAGRPLPRELRVELEAGFGVDLAALRIHVDPTASARARQLQAHAFTAGRDVYFAEHPDLSVERDRRLVAHEVAHVIQQTARPDPHNRLEVNALAGTGAPQRAAVEQPVVAAAPPAATSAPPPVTSAPPAPSPITTHAKHEEARP